jgi:twitching motility protein PilT
MSFPAEIQGNIRAQLADCLVGVVCQRLEYLEQFHLRVPRCEMLLASSGAKGTIRGGQFGGIANVIQSGGEEGMWTFDRYQRWMEQQRDWVRPSALPPGAAERELPETVRAPVRSAVRRSAPPTAGAAAAGPTEKVRSRGAKAHPEEGAAAGAGPEEINIDEDIDLDEIQELARRIEQRTR